MSNELEAIRAKIEETGILLIAGASLRAVHAEALYGSCRTLLTITDSLQAKLDEALGALEPFAKEGAHPEWAEFSDNKQIKYATELKLGDLRRAARVRGGV